MFEPDYTEIKYAIEKCINARTVGDIADILNDGLIHPTLKEIIENVEIKQKDSHSTKNVDLQTLHSVFEEEGIFQ